MTAVRIPFVVPALIAVASGSLIVFSLWPGAMKDILFSLFLGCLMLPLLGLGVLGLLGMALVELLVPSRTIRKPPKWGLVAAGIMCGTGALLAYHFPVRVAFTFARPTLEPLVESVLKNPGKQPVDLLAGIYHIDCQAADPRGGVYFRTRKGPDGIGPDEMSYGFAFRPNSEGSPFGNADYQLAHLFGDWYEFSASNDW
jgi:hypothetical protein